MKGIILAGGAGSRLYPLTQCLTKQLLPVYDKPLIYYPLATLMLAGICDILIITSPKDYSTFVKLLGDGAKWGISIEYEVQATPNGIAEAFLIGETFIGKNSCCLMLGDNILYGAGNINLFQEATNLKHGASVFCLSVSEPERYGIVTFDSNNHVVKLEEKPQNSDSNYAVIGLYFYDNQVVDIAKSLRPSERGELEITDLNKIYLEQDLLKVHNLGRGVAWFDAGTHKSLLEASNFIEIIERQQGLKIACCEEIAFHMGYISYDQVLKLAHEYGRTPYAEYLKKIVKLNEKKADLIYAL